MKAYKHFRQVVVVDGDKAYVVERGGDKETGYNNHLKETELHPNFFINAREITLAEAIEFLKGVIAADLVEIAQWLISKLVELIGGKSKKNEEKLKKSSPEAIAAAQKLAEEAAANQNSSGL